MRIHHLIKILPAILLINACSGGGGGSSSTSSGSGASTISTTLNGAQWQALAAITKNGCGERISSVRQIFAIDGDLVNTGIVTVPLTSTAEGFSFGFDEANGGCSRSYLGEFSNVSSGTANVKFTSTSSCNGRVCENEWVGTATQVSN
jgi:hypothetical protein